MPAFISAVAGVRPPSMTNAELEQAHGLELGQLAHECGVKTRTVMPAGTTQIEMAVSAAQDVLGAVETNQPIDALIFGAAVGYQSLPATAPLVKRALGLTGPCPAFDVNSTCLSALVALDQAALMIETGRAKTVLVVTSEVASCALPWKTAPATAGLFADGAAAVLMTDAPGPKLALLWRHFYMETHADAVEACQIRAGGTGLSPEDPAFATGTYFEMEGRTLFSETARAMPEFLKQFLAGAALRARDIPLVVPHQASPLALRHMKAKSWFAPNAVLDQSWQGNHVAASLPLTLETALAERRLQPGDPLVMIGTSAGLSLGAAALEVVQWT